MTKSHPPQCCFSNGERCPWRVIGAPIPDLPSPGRTASSRGVLNDREDLQVRSGLVSARSTPVSNPVCSSSCSSIRGYVSRECGEPCSPGTDRLRRCLRTMQCSHSFRTRAAFGEFTVNIAESGRSDRSSRDMTIVLTAPPDRSRANPSRSAPEPTHLTGSGVARASKSPHASEIRDTTPHRTTGNVAHRLC